MILFRVSVAVFFIAGVVISYFSLNYGIGIVIAVAVLGLILLLRENLTQYSHLENHFWHQSERMGGAALESLSAEEPFQQ